MISIEITLLHNKINVLLLGIKEIQNKPMETTIWDMNNKLLVDNTQFINLLLKDSNALKIKLQIPTLPPKWPRNGVTFHLN